MKLKRDLKVYASVLFREDSRTRNTFTDKVQDLNEYIFRCQRAYGGSALEALFKRSVDILQSQDRKGDARC